MKAVLLACVLLLAVPPAPKPAVLSYIDYPRLEVVAGAPEDADLELLFFRELPVLVAMSNSS